MTDDFHTALQKGSNGERLRRDEALAILRTGEPQNIHDLGEAAFQNRTKRFGNSASYIENLFINPSNICQGKCRFCHYSAREGDPNAYVLSENHIISQIQTYKPIEIHIVGGLNKIWHFSRILKLLKKIRAHWPDLYIKSFTAIEIDFFSREPLQPGCDLSNL